MHDFTCSALFCLKIAKGLFVYDLSDSPFKSIFHVGMFINSIGREMSFFLSATGFLLMMLTL